MNDVPNQAGFGGERIVERRLTVAEEIGLLQADPGKDGRSAFYPNLTKDEALTMVRFSQKISGGNYNPMELVRYQELQRKAAGQI